MSQRNRITVEYTLKTDAGFLVEKTQIFAKIGRAHV